MANEVKLPRLGQGMETGNIVKWLKSEGDAVKKGDPLYELDTDKVTQELEATADGVLLKIAVNEGEAAVGSVIAFIGEAGEGATLPEPEAAPGSDHGAAAHRAAAPGAEAAPGARGCSCVRQRRVDQRRVCARGRGCAGRRGDSHAGGAGSGRRARRRREDQGVAARAAHRAREGRRALAAPRYRTRRADRR